MYINAINLLYDLGDAPFFIYKSPKKEIINAKKNATAMGNAVLY